MSEDTEWVEQGRTLMGMARADTTEDGIYDWLFSNADALMDAVCDLATERAALAAANERAEKAEVEVDVAVRRHNDLLTVNASIVDSLATMTARADALAMELDEARKELDDCRAELDAMTGERNDLAADLRTERERLAVVGMGVVVRREQGVNGVAYMPTLPSVHTDAPNGSAAATQRYRRTYRAMADGHAFVLCQSPLDAIDAARAALKAKGLLTEVG